MVDKHPDDSSNLKRMDYPKSTGWWVRFRRGGKTIRRLFSDSVKYPLYIPKINRQNQAF